MVIAALTVSAVGATALPDIQQIRISQEENCCRLVINVRKSEIPCLLEQLRRLEASDLEDAAALQKMLNEKADACRKPKDGF